MQVIAKIKNLKISPKKVRLVAGLVRGKKVDVALNQLRFLNKKSAQPILELIKSAVANAEHNFKLNKENLKINEIKVDQGLTIKRFMPRAFGRAAMIRKKMSHIEVILSEIVPSKVVKGKKAVEVIKEDVVKIQSEKPKEVHELKGEKQVAVAKKPMQHVEKKTITRTTHK